MLVKALIPQSDEEQLFKLFFGDVANMGPLIVCVCLHNNSILIPDVSRLQGNPHFNSFIFQLKLFTFASGLLAVVVTAAPFQCSVPSKLLSFIMMKSIAK